MLYKIGGYKLTFIPASVRAFIKTKQKTKKKNAGIGKP
jgi:hypothetical protein